MQYPGIGPLSFSRLPEARGEAGAELELMDGSRLLDHDSEFQVRSKEDRVYHFRKDSVTVRGDGTREYALSRIADGCGNALDFERHAGRLVGINESAGRRIAVALDDGRISELSLQLPGQERRHVFVRYEYASGDLVAVMDALGRPYRLAYDQHHLVSHTDRNGLSFYYDYDRSGEEWRVIHTRGDGGLFDYQFEYVDLLNERRITDSLGNVSLVKLDDRGLPIGEIDALGGLTIYEYDDVGRTTAVVDPNGHRTEYVYDHRGNLITLIRPDGTSLRTEFDEAGRAVALVDPNGARGSSSGTSTAC